MILLHAPLLLLVGFIAGQDRPPVPKPKVVPKVVTKVTQKAGTQAGVKATTKKVPGTSPQAGKQAAKTTPVKKAATGKAATAKKNATTKTTKTTKATKTTKKADTKTAKAAKKTDAKREDIKTREADEADIIPEGATAEDIRAMKGAQAMIETEKRLAEILKKMKVGGDAEYVRFEGIDNWPYEDGFKGVPKSVRALDGKKVAMAGFMLPIDEVENIRHFYLVKSLWSCCFGIPPDVNGLVKINVKAKKGCAYQYDPILIVGTFRLKKVMDEDYCVCIYVLDDAQVKVIDLR